MAAVKKPMKKSPAAKMKTKPVMEEAPKTTSSNTKEIDKLVNDLNKKFGNNAVYRGIPKTMSETIDRIPTGTISLDIALGGGIPKGRYTEISGGLSTTKTTQSLHIVREAQKMGMTCAFIDVENTTTEDYVRQLGVDYDNLLYSNPESTEEATQIVIDMQRSGLVHLAVVDSLAALSPNLEMSKDMDDTMRMGVTPNLLNEFFRKYQMANNKLTREGHDAFTLICLNQLREKIGAYGDPEYSPGGRGKGFAATVDLRFRKGDWVAEGKGENREVVGQVVKFKIEKNKLGVRMQDGEFDFYFSENSAGIDPGFNDNYKEIIIAAVEWNVIERGGSWFSYAGQKWQGQEALVSALRDDPSMVASLKEQVLALSSRRG